MPNAEKGEGVWAASGVNAAQVGMTATETITSNPRVLGADPLVVYQPVSYTHLGIKLSGALFLQSFEKKKEFMKLLRSEACHPASG